MLPTHGKLNWLNILMTNMPPPPGCALCVLLGSHLEKLFSHIGPYKTSRYCNDQRT